MKKINKKVLCLCVILLIIIGLTLNVEISKKFIKSDTYVELENRGYNSSDVKDIKITHSYLNKILSYNEWRISVEFKEEPNIYFWFTYRDNKIIFEGVSSEQMMDKKSVIEYSEKYKRGKLLTESKDDIISDASKVATLSVDIKEIGDEFSGNLSSHQFVKDEEGIYLMITPNMVIKSFKFVSVNVEEDDEKLKYSVIDDLYSADEITPEAPFLVKMQFVGLLPTYGIVFEDQNGDERFYTINMKGIDAIEGNPYYLDEVNGGVK